MINKAKTIIKFDRKTGSPQEIDKEILEENVIPTDEFIDKLARVVFGDIKHIAEECVRECNK